jgi:signal transduction histidine kinase/CheY-like chemotaxis protein
MSPRPSTAPRSLRSACVQAACASLAVLCLLAAARALQPPAPPQVTASAPASAAALSPAAAAAAARASAPASGSDGFFDDLLRVYTPRGRCMNDEPGVIWLHVVADALIAISYFSIPLALLVFVRRRDDLAFNGMFRLFAMFIFACGLTHVIGVWDIWQPLYRVDGLVKLFTAIVSAATAVLLWRLIPLAVALPSPARLASANSELARMRDDLELRVDERTRELADATERERAARTEAESANRVKDDFLATLSHELRSPLSAIVGWTGLLARDDLDPEERRRGMEVIARNARVQTQLIEDLLDMSRITSGKMRLDVREVDLVATIGNALETVRPAAHARQQHIHQMLDPRAGPVRGDADRIQQILWNLLSNAVKFTPLGGRISVVLERGDSCAEIRVSDTGPGIAADRLPHLFDRFRQFDGSSPSRQRGLGLGLAIARQLAELHGGTLCAESEGEGRGATFRVKLPLASDEVAADGGAGEPSAVSSIRTPDVETAAMLNGLRVLVVDDEAEARELIGVILRHAGAEVDTAASTSEALELLASRHPAVLVSDIGMPESGYALLRRVRQLPAEEGGDTPALALTAFARADDRRLALLSGFQSHLAKPVEPTDLVLSVASLARRRRASSDPAVASQHEQQDEQHQRPAAGEVPPA